MEDYKELESIYKLINQKKGLLKLPGKFSKDKLFSEILSQVQIKVFEKSVKKVLSKISLEDINSFFYTIFTLFRIFIKDSTFYYYYFQESNKKFRILLRRE